MDIVVSIILYSSLIFEGSLLIEIVLHCFVCAGLSLCVSAKNVFVVSENLVQYLACLLLIIQASFQFFI